MSALSLAAQAAVVFACALLAASPCACGAHHWSSATCARSRVMVRDFAAGWAGASAPRLASTFPFGAKDHQPCVAGDGGEPAHVQSVN